MTPRINVLHTNITVGVIPMKTAAPLEREKHLSQGKYQGFEIGFLLAQLDPARLLDKKNWIANIK